MKHPIADSHCDFLTALTDEKQINFITNLSDDCQILNSAVFTTEKNINFTKIIEYKNRLENLQAHTTTKLLFSIEDCGCLQFNKIKHLASLHPFCVSLTWNEANQYAGGALSNESLTKAGKKALSLLEKNKIFIDTAHLNEKSFWQVCEWSNIPVLNTHCNIFSLFPHQRNLTDKQIEKIVLSNGYMGLTLYQKFIANYKTTAKDIALQFDYLIKHFDHKHFGLGTDFFGIDTQFLPQDLKSHADLQLLANELRLLGYNDNIVYDVLYKNFYRFIKQNDIFS